jgi:flagellar biosynthesis/type III secretory pathway protein FliH
LRAAQDPHADPSEILVEAAPVVRELLEREGGIDGLTLLVRADLDVEGLRAKVRRVVGKRAEEVVMNTAQQLIEKGKKEGERRGERRGLARGRRQGLEQGLEHGQRALIERQIRARFGEVEPAVVARIQKGTVAELERWAERLLSTKRVEDVFLREPRAGAERPRKGRH